MGQRRAARRSRRGLPGELWRFCHGKGVNSDTIVDDKHSFCCAVHCLLFLIHAAAASIIRSRHHVFPAGTNYDPELSPYVALSFRASGFTVSGQR
ncbi:hypothetical protein D3C77_721090 [compost metagenome]